jgi:hypothetical protein
MNEFGLVGIKICHSIITGKRFLKDSIHVHPWPWGEGGGGGDFSGHVSKLFEVVSFFIDITAFFEFLCFQSPIFYAKLFALLQCNHSK